jgi:hypothetical protein
VQDKSVQQLVNIVTAAGVAEAGFPVRVSLPLYLGVYATVSFENCIAGASPCADVAADVATDVANGWRPAAALFVLPSADEYKWSKKTQRASAARAAATAAATAAAAGNGTADGCSSSTVSTADVTPTAHAATANSSSDSSAAARRLEAVD